MKLNKLIKNFENFFSWDQEEIEANSNKINLLREKLLKKRKSLEKKLKYSKEEDKKIFQKKLKAIKKLIKKAKKNLY